MKKNASIIEPRAKKTNDHEDQNNQHKNTDSFGFDSFSKFVFNYFDNNNNGSEVLNEQNNRNDKIEPREEKSPREERTRQIEAIDFEQQRINKIAETVRNRQLRNRAEANTVEFRIGFTRRHFSGFVQFFQKVVRPFFVHTRKDEVREKFEKRREETKRHEKGKQKNEIKRLRF